MYAENKLMLNCIDKYTALITQVNYNDDVCEFLELSGDDVIVRLRNGCTIATHISKVRIPQGVIDKFSEKIKKAKRDISLQTLRETVADRESDRTAALNNILRPIGV